MGFLGIPEHDPTWQGPTRTGCAVEGNQAILIQDTSYYGLSPPR